MKMILWIVCALLGFGAYRGLARLWSEVVERIPAEQRSRSYNFAKNFPGIAFNTAVIVIFLAALGATVIHFVAIPDFAAELREATSWGPGTVVGMLGLLLYGWWCAPDSPPAAPPRGRSLKRPKHATRSSQPSTRRPLTSSSRGRTIRTFREKAS